MLTLSDYATFEPDSIAAHLARIVIAADDTDTADAVDYLVTLANIEEQAPNARRMQEVLEDAYRAGYAAALDALSETITDAAQDAAFVAVIREREPNVRDMAERLQRDIEDQQAACKSGDDNTMQGAWDYASEHNVWADA